MSQNWSTSLTKHQEGSGSIMKVEGGGEESWVEMITLFI